MSERFIVPGETHPIEFTGDLIAEVSTETDTAVRWTVLELYKVTEGKMKDGYILHRIGESIVYHRPEQCNFGVPTDWQHVPDDAEPCEKCHPEPGGSGGQYEVWLEQARHHIDRCADASDVEDALLMKNKHRAGSRFLSNPARNLLAMAAREDEGIRSLTRRVESLD